MYFYSVLDFSYDIRYTRTRSRGHLDNSFVDMYLDSEDSRVVTSFLP